MIIREQYAQREEPRALRVQRQVQKVSGVSMLSVKRNCSTEHAVLVAIIGSTGCMFAAQVHAAEELEEITVTAQKRTERLQDVPISISVLSSDAIVGRSLSDLSSLSNQVVGVQSIGSDQGGSNADYYIRGIGQGDFIDTNDPGVGIYIDGVFIARTAGGLLDLTDVDRVEVLRGPQGTLFGKNTVGGAISVWTNKPNFTYSGVAFIRAGERDRFDAGVTVNVPISDNYFAIRFDALTKNQEGFGRSLETGAHYSGEGKEYSNCQPCGCRWMASK